MLFLFVNQIPLVYDFLFGDVFFHQSADDAKYKQYV